MGVEGQRHALADSPGRAMVPVWEGWECPRARLDRFWIAENDVSPYRGSKLETSNS